MVIGAKRLAAKPLATPFRELRHDCTTQTYDLGEGLEHNMQIVVRHGGKNVAIMDADVFEGRKELVLGNLTQLMVLPGYRGQHISYYTMARLLEHVDRELERLGVDTSKLKVTCSSTKRPIDRLLEKLGATVVERKGFERKKPPEKDDIVLYESNDFDGMVGEAKSWVENGCEKLEEMRKNSLSLRRKKSMQQGEVEAF